MFDHEKLNVYRCAQELYAVRAPAVASFPRGHGAIVDQLRQAMLSIPLNIAEACGKTSHNARTEFVPTHLRGSASNNVFAAAPTPARPTPSKSPANASDRSPKRRLSAVPDDHRIEGDVFSYVFMKILERRPRSYDRRMNRVSRGRVRRIKEQVATLVPPNARVLEIGCGTGELAGLMVARGATVEGFDRSPQMVAAAQERIEAEGLTERLTVRHMGVDGMDGLEAASYDVVVSTLVLSELTDDERRYALRHAQRVLRPGGLIVLADEVWPKGLGRRLTHRMTRAPLAVITHLISTSSTRPLRDLAGDLTRAGFAVDDEQRSHGDAFAIIQAHRGAAEATA